MRNTLNAGYPEGSYSPMFTLSVEMSIGRKPTAGDLREWDVDGSTLVMDPAVIQGDANENKPFPWLLVGVAAVVIVLVSTKG